MTIPLKSFYFIRHGETDWNKRGIIMGSKDIELNSHGISQAEQAKHSFKGLDISAIYSSSAKRAHHTANIVNEVLNLPITCTDLLIERGWGVSEGDHVDEFKHIFIRPVDTIEDHELPVNAETWSYFSVRIIRVLTEILEASNKPPLIVAHGGVFLGITALLGIDNFRAKNCEPYLFKAPSESLDRWNIVNLEEGD